MVLNVGNSRLGVGIFSRGELIDVRRIPHTQRGDWPAQITEAWQKISGLGHAAVAAASVNPPLDSPLDKIVEDITGLEIQYVGADLELPIEVKTQAPAQTGVDRVLNVAAAYQQLERACVVVDAGTAVTVDFCDDKGAFLGGAIAPGLGMMLDELNQKTAKLPRVQFEVPKGAFGDSTESAICQGVYHSIRGLVREVVENFATELGRWPEVIATGGDAKALFEGWEVIHAISPDLALYGISLAYTEHQIRNEM